MAAPERISRNSSNVSDAETEHSVAEDLSSRLACPVCAGSDALTPSEGKLLCSSCETQYPVYRSGGTAIPWVFADPENALLEWKSRLNRFLSTNWAEQTRLRKAARGRQLSNFTKRRLGLLLEGRMTQRLQVTELLSPLDLEYANFDKGSDPASLLRGRVPSSAGIASHYAHIFRDWSWDNGESEEQFDAVRSVLNDISTASLGATLTIGAGACRLPYDIHRTLAPKLSVVMDVNPLLLFAASQIIRGASVALVEFPSAPIKESGFAVNQECFAPEPLEHEDSFYFLLADGTRPPLADASFDTIITPWLIDVIPQSLRDFALAVNRILPVGGQWINSGSLAFAHRDATHRLSEEEALECVERCGFEITATDRRRIPYMQSPHDAHWRHESVLSFRARKTRDAEETRHLRHLPEWLIDTSTSIPVLTEFSEASSENLLRAKILAAIDGRQSVDEIGSSLAREYGLRVAEAQNAVRRMLLDLYENQICAAPDTSEDML